jgi:uncharacterized protein DUF1918
MEIGKVGDLVSLESERVGHPPREGVILKVMGEGAGIHYLVRWEDEHESTLFPESGILRIVPKKAKATV